MKKSLSLLLILVFASSCTVTSESSSSPISETDISASTPYAAISPTPPLPEETSTSSPASYPVESIKFITTDGITLAGTLFGEGDTAVTLAHQGNYGIDQASWFPFAHLLAERGYAALTFDFRGMGQSEGKLVYRNLPLDIDAAVHFLQDQGYSRIVCMGASMGGTSCLRTAQDYSFAGLVIIASVMNIDMGTDSLFVTQSDLGNLAQEKLFVTAAHDHSLIVSNIKMMHELSPDPKDLLIIQGRFEHGTDLFTSDAEEELSNALLQFLETIDN